jgi:hypothetical protein
MAARLASTRAGVRNRRKLDGVTRVLPAIILTLSAAAAPAATPTSSADAPSASAPAGRSTGASDLPCPSGDPQSIVVCAQRGQAYRLDSNVIDASRQAEANGRSASSAAPPAQAVCAASPMGCGTGLEGLDLANVAIVAGTTAVRAAKGEDWRRAFRTGGADEYQLYRQAKQRREAQEAERKAAAIKWKAEEAEREAAATSTNSK